MSTSMGTKLWAQVWVNPWAKVWVQIHEYKYWYYSMSTNMSTNPWVQVEGQSDLLIDSYKTRMFFKFWLCMSFTRVFNLSKLFQGCWSAYIAEGCTILPADRAGSEYQRTSPYQGNVRYSFLKWRQNMLSFNNFTYLYQLNHNWLNDSNFQLWAVFFFVWINWVCI